MLDGARGVDTEEWVIWNGAAGLLMTAATGRIEVDAGGGRTARLARPFDMVGPFSLDELETRGRIDFAACVVMSRRRWQEDQAGLRRQAFERRREARARMEAEQAGFDQGMGGRWRPAPADDRLHREALNLPLDGALDPARIKAAFRRLAQKAHPNVGGSHEQFVRISRARDVLLDGVTS